MYKNTNGTLTKYKIKMAIDVQLSIHEYTSKIPLIWLLKVVFISWSENLIVLYIIETRARNNPIVQDIYCLKWDR